MEKGWGANSVNRPCYGQSSRAFWLVLSLLLLLFAQPVSAQSAKIQALWKKQLSLQFADLSLRDALDSLAKSQNVDIMLDRRVDPNRLVEVKIDRASLRETFEKLALSLGLDFCPIGSVAYLGPRGSAQQLLQTLSQHRHYLSQFPQQIAKTYLESGSWSCSRLDTPQMVLSKLANRQNVRWSNLDRLPHDLLPNCQFKEVTLCETVALLLIGFEHTFSISEDGTTWTLVPFADLPFQTMSSKSTSKPRQQTKRDKPDK